MLALLYKDLLMIKRQVVYTLLLFFALTGYLMYMGHAYSLPAAFTMLAFILPTMTFGYDEQCGFAKFAFSGPLTRKEYVFSKYIPAWLIGLVSAVAAALMSALRFQQEAGMVMIFAALSFALPVIITALLYPFIIKFGVEKGRLVMVVAYMLFFTGLSYMKVGMQKGLTWLAQLQKLTLPQMAGLLLLATLATLGVSLAFSSHNR